MQAACIPVSDIVGKYKFGVFKFCWFGISNWFSACAVIIYCSFICVWWWK